MTLRAKTALLLALLVIASIGLTSAILINLYERSLKKDLLRDVKAIATASAASIGDFLDDTLRDAHSIAATLPAEALEMRDTRAIERHLARMLEIYPKFQNGIFLLDAQGAVIADYPSHPEVRGRSFAFREYFQTTLREQRGVIGVPYRSARTQEPVLTFTAPLKDAAGATVAVLGCSVQLLAPNALEGLRQRRIGESGYLYVFDTSRLMILHPDRSRILQRDVAPGANRMLDAAIQGFEGSGETVNSRGMAMLLALKRVPGTDWIVGAQQTQAEAYRTIRDAAHEAAYVSLFCAGIAAFVGALAVGRITTPLARLRAAATEIGQQIEFGESAGGTGHALEQLRGHDEIGKLAETFHELVRKLDQTLASLRKAAADWERTFDSVHDAVVIVDDRGAVVRANHTARSWFGEHCGASSGGETPAFPQWPKAGRASETSAPVRSEVHDPTSDRHYELTVCPLIRVDGACLGAVRVARDITESKLAAARIEAMAYFDTLTGLPNRRQLEDRLESEVARADRIGKLVGLMFIDLDRFKLVNDTWGHAVGDELLKAAATRLTGCLRRNDTVARLGGDELVVLLTDLTHPEEAACIARKLIAVMAEPFLIEDQQLQSSISIGIALFPIDAKEASALLRCADLAMYRAKQNCRGTFTFFDSQEEEKEEYSAAT